MPEATIRKLEEIGIPAVCIDPVDPLMQEKSIRILGKLFGAEQRAEEFIRWRRDVLALISDRLKGVRERKRAIACMLFKPGEFPKRVFASNYVMNPTLEWAGLENLGKTLPGFSVDVDAEWFVESDPDVIIVGDWNDFFVGYKVGDPSVPAEALLKLVKSETWLEQVRAVKEGRVYLVEYMLLGTRAFMGSLYLAKAVYPERFGDVDPEKYHREYFERWLGVEYGGIWFFPTPEARVPLSSPSRGV